MMRAPNSRDSLGEWGIIAIVVIVLGVAATSTRLESSAPMTPVLSQALMVSPISPDRVASNTRMISPIGRNCVRKASNDTTQCALPDERAALD